MAKINPLILNKRREAILALEVYGCEVVEFTKYHYRVNGMLDLYPVSMKYHFLQSDKWGVYPKDIIDFVHKELKL